LRRALTELAKVIVDRLNLGEVVHWNSRSKVKGWNGWTKNPRGVREEHDGALLLFLWAIDRFQ
jgi:hypothetical protein